MTIAPATIGVINIEHGGEGALIVQPSDPITIFNRLESGHRPPLLLEGMIDESECFADRFAPPFVHGRKLSPLRAYARPAPRESHAGCAGLSVSDFSQRDTRAQPHSNSRRTRRAIYTCESAPEQSGFGGREGVCVDEDGILDRREVRVRHSG